jgi:MFS family permease
VKGLPRTTLLLSLACAAGSAMLAASQFMDMFHLVPPGGEAVQSIDSSDQHGYALLVLAILSLVLLAVSLTLDPGGERHGLWQVTVVGVAVTGVIALLLFLTVDLPDVNKIGTVDDPRENFIDAKAEPQAGFWFELAGSLVLATCGIALATFRSKPADAPDGAASPSGGAAVERSRS